MKETLLIIQPILPKYRVPLFKGLCEFYDIHILCNNQSSSDGFGNVKDEDKNSFSSVIYTNNIFFGNRLFFQRNIIKTIKSIKPDKILACGATNDFGFWLLLIYSKISGKKLFVHTQGPFNKDSNSIFYKLIYKVIIYFSYKVILYTKFSYKKLHSLNIFSEKICYVNNTLELPLLEPIVKKKQFNPSPIKLLFIGRIRSGNGLNKLLNFIQKNKFIEINIIGEGNHFKELQENYSANNIKWHGGIFNPNQIQKISNKCHFGVYPGNAGLSIVHYLSLNLPVIVHSNITTHQGPEPSYIKNGFNGYTFIDSNDKNTLFSLLEYTYKNLSTNNYEKMCLNANTSFKNLSNPSYSKKIYNVLNG
jgi:hypothetical protein